MELNDSDDLIKFINKETKKTDELDLTHSYKIFCRSLPKIISNIYKKTYEITNINSVDVIIAGCDMLHNIYWFVLRYTNNCDVALFLSETSINLFVESLISSYETTQDNPFKIIPNISDSIRFAYKKTIGPLPSSFNCCNEIDNPQLASLIIKMFTVQIMKQIIISGILPNNKKAQSPLSKNEKQKLLPKIEILLDYIQQNNKNMIRDVWHVIYYIINKNSENLTDKLYYQINHYVNNYSLNNEKKNVQCHNELDWIHNKQTQVQSIFKNVNSLIMTIKDF
jgi:hypothetical protein